MANAPRTIKVEAEIPEWAFDALKDLADSKGSNANTVLQQAIAAFKFLSDEQSKGGKVLIEKPNRTYSKVEIGS